MHKKGRREKHNLCKQPHAVFPDILENPTPARPTTPPTMCHLRHKGGKEVMDDVVEGEEHASERLRNCDFTPRSAPTSPPSSKTNSPTSTTVTYLGAFNYSNAPQQLIHPLQLLVHVKPTSWNSRCPSKVFRSNRLAGGQSLIRKSSLKKCHTGPD